MSKGQKIGGRFEIGDELGEGGMGTVYHGIDTQSNQPVAIKALKSDIVKSTPDIVERFAREGEVLRKLNHPNIVKVLATVEEEGEHYIVMEYVGGGSLRDILDKQQQLPVEQVLEIALDLSDALARAHRLKVIHRDLKPANVLLAEDGTPRLTDFGIARVGDAPRMTQTGMIMGTLAYLSPEACNAEPLDARADIWAFGVMLYEMLAGRRPFMEDSTTALLISILTKPAPDLLQFREDVPIALMGLVIWMMEKDRNQRVSSVRLVGAQIEAMLTGEDAALQAFIEPGGTGSGRLITPSSADVIPQDREELGGVLDGPTVTPSPVESVHLSDLSADFAPTGELDGPTITPTPARHDAGIITRPDWTMTTTRQIERPPRIFISYRRSDSIAITGRLYDRLSAAFGEDNVFKDVDKIPLGVNFKQVLDSEVASCDVLLIIIGPEWARVSDKHGRRLDDPDDFVRIEVEAGLRRDDVLVIPVLVNNASMPTVEQLPGGLNDLIYRNAATVRNDPDFNRDVQWLINQINGSFEVKKERLSLPFSWRVAAVAMLIVALVAVIAILLGNQPSVDEELSEDTFTIASVESVTEREAMVLVGQIEQLGDSDRDATRLIMDDLRQKLENDVPFSNVHIREYPDVISSSEQALQIAEANGAAVVIWGNDDDSVVELAVEMGSLDLFPLNEIPRETLERTVNVRVRVDDLRGESVAGHALTVLYVLYFADDAIWDSGRTVAILDALEVNPAETVGTGVAAHFHRAGLLYHEDTSAAIEEYDAAISLDGGNPILYVARALGRSRLQQFDLVGQDLNTAQQRGPEGWLSPVIMNYAEYLVTDNVAGSIPTLIDDMNTFIEKRPEDWYGYATRGMAYLIEGDSARAQEDFDRAIELDPDLNIPYLYATLLAINEGRFIDATHYVSEARIKFPDPEYGIHLMNATFGGGEDSLNFAVISAFSSFMLKQYNDVINRLEPLVNEENGAQSSELPLFLGMAHCALGNYEEAEAAYTLAINADPDYSPAYSLRSEVRLRQGNIIGAGADVAAVMDSGMMDELGEGFMALVPLMQSGEINCANLLDVDYEAIFADATAVAATQAAMPTPTATPEPIVIDPVEANEFMVLVAQIEHLGGDERDVQRFIVDDLRQHFEEIPYSIIRIRSYPAIITSDEQAREIAEEYDATAIIWGNYDQSRVEVEVQVGDLSLYPDLLFSREEVEAITNARVHMTSERSETLAYSVVAVMNALFPLSNETFEMTRNLVILDTITEPPAEPEGNSIAAHYHRYILNFPDNTEQAIAEIDAAIRLESNNPLLFLARGLARQRLGQIDEAAEDTLTSQRLGPEGWASPLWMQANEAFYFRNEMESALSYYNEIVAITPDDWFALSMHGAVAYLLGDYETTKNDVERAITLDTETNFPYLFAISIALREGRFAEAQELLDTVLHQFPDPTFGEQMVTVTISAEAAENFFHPTLAAFGNLTLRQWSSVVSDVDEALATGVEMSDLHYMQGFAYCNLGDYESAETAYTAGIELDPDFTLLYALRAEVRRYQGDILGAGADVAMIGQGEQAEIYAPFIAASLAGEVTCENFFDVDLESLLATPEATESPGGE